MTTIGELAKASLEAARAEVMARVQELADLTVTAWEAEILAAADSLSIPFVLAMDNMEDGELELRGLICTYNLREVCSSGICLTAVPEGLSFALAPEVIVS